MQLTDFFVQFQIVVIVVCQVRMNRIREKISTEKKESFGPKKK